MKMFQIINAISAFTKLAASDMKMTDAYRLQKLLSSLQVEIDFFNDQKLKLAQKYGTINDDGSVDIPPDKVSEAQAALDDIMDVDVKAEYEVVKIPISDNIEVSTNDIGVLSPFVEFIFSEDA